MYSKRSYDVGWFTGAGTLILWTTFFDYNGGVVTWQLLVGGLIGVVVIDLLGQRIAKAIS